MIEAQPGGGWKITVEAGRDPLNGRRRRVVRSLPKGTTRREAKDLEATLRLKARGRQPAANTLTVGEILDQWLEHIEADLSPTTVQGYKSQIEQYLRPAFGTLLARKLTPERIDALYRRMRTKGVRGHELSPATIRRTHASLRSACAQAVKWGWLPANPCDRATVPRQIRHDIDPPTIADIEKVVAHADENLRDAISLAIATGARRGELCGLQWADLDLDAGAVTFRRSIGDVAGEVVVIDDRRKSSIRTVAIDEVAVEALRARRARMAELALSCGVPFDPSGYVLADDGQAVPLRPQLLSARWRVAARQTGVHARLHDLRHWHVTELLRSGVPTPNVVKRAGWASPQMLRVYAHAVEEVDREAATVIGRSRRAVP